MTHRRDLIETYEITFAKVIGNIETSALSFWRGRVALWTVLKALNLTEGDEVVLPALTCEMVPIAVKFVGGKSAYVDTKNGSFTTVSDRILDCLRSRTKAVILQHTYGLIDSVVRKDLITSIRSRGIAVIEDCCHLIRTEELFANNYIPDVTFFSTQWNKPFSTGLGGMAVFGNQDLYLRAKEIRASFPTEHRWQRAHLLALQILLYRLTVNPCTRAWIGRAYRSAQHMGWKHGTSSIAEYGDIMPADYLAGPTDVQARVGLRQLRSWPDNVRHRKHLTEFYIDQLSAMGIDKTSFGINFSEPVLWAIPLLVENKTEILSSAAKWALPIATWFDRTPVHIDPVTAARYGYRPGYCPRSEGVFTREIHLLTAPWVSLKSAGKAITYLKEHARFSICPEYKMEVRCEG